MQQYGKICVNMVDPRKKKNSYVEPVKTLQINFEDPMSELVASGANVSVNQSKKAIMKEKKKQLKRKGLVYHHNHRPGCFSCVGLFLLFVVIWSLVIGIFFV